MKKISIVIPVYNEEESIKECYRRINDIIFSDLIEYENEIIFINDGSKDKTFKILEEISQNNTNVKIISFSRNFGHQCAVTAGLKETTGDAVIIIDADMQDPPELIKDMIKLWEDGNEVIYGKRKKRNGESIFKIITAKAFYKILNRTF
jgi:dolichol-phosphate mannosyltransferase